MLKLLSKTLLLILNDSNDFIFYYFILFYNSINSLYADPRDDVHFILRISLRHQKHHV